MEEGGYAIITHIRRSASIPTQKAHMPQQLMARAELLQSAQLLSLRAVSGLTDMARMWGIGSKKS